MEGIEKFIAIIGRENISIVLVYFLVKRLINGLIPCIEEYVRAKARAIGNEEVEGEKSQKRRIKRIDEVSD